MELEMIGFGQTNRRRNMHMKRFSIKSGLSILVRHIAQGDAPHFVNIFQHMGPDSRYRRFHQPMVNPTAEMIWREAKRIEEMDGIYNDGLLAFVEREDGSLRPIAAARYIALSPGVVEVAMSVRDDYQNLGVGTLLLQLLTEEAHLAGVEKMVGTVMNSNDGMWIVLERLDFPVLRRVEGTESTIEVDLRQRKKKNSADGL
jgi:acetyltransferase